MKQGFLVMLTYDNGEKRLFDMRLYFESGLFAQLKDKLGAALGGCFFLTLLPRP